MKSCSHACHARYLTKTHVCSQRMTGSSDIDVPQVPDFLPSADGPVDRAALIVFVCIS